MQNSFGKKLSEYEVNKIRAEPEKYLWDALDRYFGVLNITPGAMYKMQELLTMRIWAADDVEQCALACSLITKEELALKGDETLESKNRIARQKVGLVLNAMKRAKVGKINLELKNKRPEEKIEDTT